MSNTSNDPKDQVPTPKPPAGKPQENESKEEFEERLGQVEN
ncbi:hypothetical protein [Compostimonas suwonensis]|uniref:Uncharacterized protein n=1 Tax=Compostimonas suwonensis TaxID=1048394 RepID=A0A2M9BB11_9MICO|nr:hypothetical protein [Compostimonas suwonensis]PJJ55126.1 hypothetical protein CLV54_3466 [Compostimonas suwonensis]